MEIKTERGDGVCPGYLVHGLGSVGASVSGSFCAVFPKGRAGMQ